MSRRGLKRASLSGLVMFAAAVLCCGQVMAGGGGATSTIAVSGTQWGVSTCYIGATEGNVRFDVNDLKDLGINTYRVYGGMQRWEAQDDDGVYGSPAIADIKANPNAINWSWWDNVMTSPPNGSDYWWSGDTNLWQGSASKLFGDLKAAGIKPVLTLRNRDNNNNPSWAPNPPKTQADWNEWWEHVFATVYWLNVRNDYQVNDFEVHNEPDNSGQGWGGTEADYFDFVKQTKDAIDYVYKTYLPGRSYHVYATVTKGGSSWPSDALQQIPSYFDSMDVHTYNSDISAYVEQVHGWMNSAGHGDYPLWLSEWGTYRGQYDSTSFDIGVIKNLMRGSRPGNDYVYGSHIFTMYDWDGFSGGFQNFVGLVGPSGNKIAGYYAFRLGVRALQGCRPTYQSTSSSTNLMAMTTKDAAGHIYFLVTNDSNTAQTVDVNLSALITSGTGTLREFSAANLDAVVGNPVLANGHLTLNIPGQSAQLVQF